MKIVSDFPFMRYNLHSPNSPKVELTTHLQSKNTTKITSKGNFIVFLPALD